MKATRQALRSFVGLIVALTGTTAIPTAPSLAQTVVAVQSTQANAASDAEVCVGMSGSGGRVSGIQMNMNWDAQCLQVIKGNGDEASCTKGSETGRDTFRTRVLNSNTLKMIMLSISDTSPMPDNIQLFCCSFLTSDSITSSRQCAVNVADVIASDPTGQRLSVSPRPGIVTVTGASGGVSGSGTGVGGPGMGMPPPVIIPGQAPAGSGGQPAPAAGSAPAPAAPAAAAAPAAPAVPAVPAMPAAPAIPAAPSIEDAGAAVATVLATVLSTPQAQRTRTAAHSPAPAGTSTPQTAAGTPKVQGTPTHATKHPGPAGTPTPKAKGD